MHSTRRGNGNTIRALLERACPAGDCMRVVQLSHVRGDRRVAVVEAGHLRVLSGPKTVFALATAALEARISLRECAARHLSPSASTTTTSTRGSASGAFFPVVDHADDPARLLVSGTGLTHRRSADQRQSMHAGDARRPTACGCRARRRGRPAVTRTASAMRRSGSTRGTARSFAGTTTRSRSRARRGRRGRARDRRGVSRGRVGVPGGSAWPSGTSSPTRARRPKLLYLAASKLRESRGRPELVLDPDFSDVAGEVAIERDGRVLWSRAIRTGEAAMCHSLENMEHHHFKFDEPSAAWRSARPLLRRGRLQFRCRPRAADGRCDARPVRRFRPRAAQCGRRGQDSAAFGECAADLGATPNPTMPHNRKGIQ